MPAATAATCATSSTVTSGRVRDWTPPRKSASPQQRDEENARTTASTARHPSRGSAAGGRPRAGELGELEARLLAERAAEAAGDDLVAAGGLAAAPAAQEQREQLPLGLDVERLELRQPPQELAGGVELTRADAHAGQRAQHPAGERAQARALGQRPLRVGLVGEEVPPVQRRGAAQRRFGAA